MQKVAAHLRVKIFYFYSGFIVLYALEFACIIESRYVREVSKFARSIFSFWSAGHRFMTSARVKLFLKSTKLSFIVGDSLLLPRV